MVSYVLNKFEDSSNATEGNNCIFGYKSSLEEKFQSKVSLDFSKARKNKLCRSSKSPCKAEVKIALVNCSSPSKQLICCEFHSIQIISSDNKIDVNGNVVINTSISVNLKMLKTLDFTTDSKHLTTSAPVTVELFNCSLVKAVTTSSEIPSTTKKKTITTTTTATTTTTTTSTTPTTTTTATTSSTTKTTTTTTTTTMANPGTTSTTTTTTTTTPTTMRNSTATINKTVSTTPGRKAKSKSSNGKIALVILAIFILMGVGIIACYYKYRKKLSDRPAYYNDISLNDPLHTEIKFCKADGEDTEDNVEEDDDDDILPLI